MIETEEAKTSKSTDHIRRKFDGFRATDGKIVQMLRVQNLWFMMYLILRTFDSRDPLSLN